MKPPNEFPHVDVDRRRDHQLILASASPRRRDLLESAGLTFRVIHPDIDEAAIAAACLREPIKRDVSDAPFENAIARYSRQLEFVMTAAGAKARAVAETLTESERVDVIGADTIIVHPAFGVMGKPNSPDEARQMLTALSGVSHRVLTGVAIVRHPEKRAVFDVAVSTVMFHPLAVEDIDRYIASGEWRDKAGAYAIQGHARRFIRALDGDYDTVVGLPVKRVIKLLAEL